MFKFLKQKNNNAGFTLVETLVAIAIFSVSIVALMSVLAKGVSDTSYAKNKTIASFLAEEGIEYVRNMRDTYMIYDVDPVSGWTNFLTKINNCVTALGCSFDDTLNSYNLASLVGMNVPQCSGNSCLMYYNTATGRYSYSHSLGSDSGFTRVIKVTKMATNSNEIMVTVTVSWTKNSLPYSVIFSDNLLEWKEKL